MVSHIIGDVQGNNIVDYIPESEVTADHIITYAKFLCDYRPLKAGPCRVKLTVGRDTFDCFDNIVSPAISLLEIPLNSTVLDTHKCAQFFNIVYWRVLHANIHEGSQIHEDLSQVSFIRHQGTIQH